MASNHPAVLQGAPIEKRARRAHQVQGAVSPEWLQGAVARMTEHPTMAMLSGGGPGSMPVVQHHRRLGPAGFVSGIGSSGGVFLARSCAVQWEHPSARPVPVPHYFPPAGKPQTDPSGAPIGGSWLPPADPYNAWGHAQPAIEEDADRAPYEPPAGKDSLFGAAVIVLAGLILLACCITTDGGFRP
jgi:hypothetical protein